MLGRLVEKNKKWVAANNLYSFQKDDCLFFILFSSRLHQFIFVAKDSQKRKGGKRGVNGFASPCSSISTFHFSRATLLSVPERKREIIFSHHLCSIEYYQSEANSSENPAIFLSFTLRNDNFSAPLHSINNDYIYILKFVHLNLSLQIFLCHFTSSKSLAAFSKRIYIPSIFLDVVLSDRNFFFFFFRFKIVLFTSVNMPKWVCGHFLWWFLFEMLLSLFPFFTLEILNFLYACQTFSSPSRSLSIASTSNGIKRTLSRLRANAFDENRMPKNCKHREQHSKSVQVLYLVENSIFAPCAAASVSTM